MLLVLACLLSASLTALLLLGVDNRRLRKDLQRVETAAAKERKDFVDVLTEERKRAELGFMSKDVAQFKAATDTRPCRTFVPDDKMLREMEIATKGVHDA